MECKLAALHIPEYHEVIILTAVPRNIQLLLRSFMIIWRACTQRQFIVGLADYVEVHT